MREYSYGQAAAVSLLIHVLGIVVLALAPLNHSRPAYEPPSVVEIVPARVLSMGDMGDLSGMTADDGAASPQAEAASAIDPVPVETVRKTVPEETVAKETTASLPDDRSEALPPILQGNAKEPALGTLVSAPGKSGEAAKPVGSHDGGDQEIGRRAGGSNGSGGPGHNQARVLQGARPRYPAAARRAGWEGTVVVRILVGADGAAEAVTIRESSGFSELDAAALYAVKKWQFAPAMKNGQPVAGFHAVRIRFRLTDPS